jgi:hypothetical protein
MRPPITIEEGRREEEGSCNACHRRDTPLVTVVNLRTLSFRLCEDCTTDLLHKLAARPPKPGVPA